ncbi:ABC transporter substrate-binding protein [Acinetobacter pseudolwoffii]|uniref:ABC transporter substrate-binding protein n=1 Tax=Acinetobacter pseudolwoffii TaxID=2053287 RepID=UPI000C231A58|nr:CmpA/NrtA family ABC transporter substrate-binding protein [Acinetobacter pseudolwoffii]MDM1336235.1 ABC transporter substrate-binding protein [Acinetobacter pseudolwoffii]PJI30837.1 nitrate transporter [Acinetobacter pseudolwoffii]
MSTLEKTELNIGYIPLLDCVAILWAEKQGYFAEQGLKINLIREASWSSLRDRLAYGFLDTAHCLSAMLPAAALGTDQLQVALQTPLVLSINQAYISLRQDLCYELGIHAEDDEKSSSQKLVRALQHHQKVNLAYVYKHSIHHYCIKEWLALTDFNIAHTIHLMTSPPASMVKGISEQVFDGFCVGEPWNIQAKLEGYSLIVAASQNVIPKVADKVLAMTQEWAELHPCTVKALVNAVQKAQTDLKQRADLSQVWDMLVDYQIIQFECSAQRHVCDYHKIQNIIRNLVGASAKPQLADFIWLIEQIEKWDGVEISEIEKKQIAAQCMYAEMLFA